MASIRKRSPWRVVVDKDNAKPRDHVIALIRMSVLQSSDIVTYRDERVKVVKGATVKKELELLSRVIAIARAE